MCVCVCCGLEDIVVCSAVGKHISIPFSVILGIARLPCQ